MELWKQFSLIFILTFATIAVKYTDGGDYAVVKPSSELDYVQVMNNYVDRIFQRCNSFLGQNGLFSPMRLPDEVHLLQEPNGEGWLTDLGVDDGRIFGVANITRKIDTEVQPMGDQLNVNANFELATYLESYFISFNVKNYRYEGHVSYPVPSVWTFQFTVSTANLSVDVTKHYVSLVTNGGFPATYVPELPENIYLDSFFQDKTSKNLNILSELYLYSFRNASLAIAVLEN